MRLVTGLVVAATLAVAAAGCGSDDAADDTTNDPGASADVTVSEASWSVAVPPGGTEFSIIVPVGSSSCDFFDRVEIDETTDAVTITAYVGSRAADVCTDDFVEQQVTVSLVEPLGERSLLGCRPNGDDDPSFDCR